MKRNGPDCYRCKYREDLLGSCHSACGHPAFKAEMSDPMARVMAIFASVGRVPPIQAKGVGIKVVGNPHGIRHGWFNHPFNFDPVWLEECSGFEEKSEAA